MNEIPTSPEAPPEAVKPRFGRKLYLVIGLVAIAIIVTASIITYTQFLPSARGEAVTLGLNYSVGEKMTYKVNMTVKAMFTEFSQGGTLEMEVIGFDGENYTIRQTITFGSQDFSFTIKMDQMGNLIEYTDLPGELEQTFSSFFGVPGFGSYFPKEEVKVGESWEIPLDIEAVGMNLEGTMSYTLSEITSVTVPAGTYEALKIDIEASDLQLNLSMEDPVEGMESSLTMNINGYVYLENATCRLIELRLDQSVTMTAMGQTQSMEMTLQTQLVEHLK